MTTEEKAFDATALNKSVQVIPEYQSAFSSDATANALFFVAQQADEMEAWGRNVKLRDKQLREFIPIEDTFLGALGIVCSANAAFSWTIKGPPRVAERYQTMLQQANFGEGWENLITKVSIDLYTQDSGAFIEVIREGDSESAPVAGLAHLDAARCWPTGHPDVPVLYQDRNGKYHYLKWYQVITITDMPAPIEGRPGIQYCALTRLLRSARILRDIGIYMSEKVGGRNNRAVTLVKGVTPKQIEDAWAQQKMRMDAIGLLRFSMPLMIGSVDPKADIGFETLEIASLPDSFDLDLTMKQYINQIAMAFKRDYQDFAPLPGGNLGTSAQSEILHQKSRGKGPGEFRKLIAQAINWVVLPADTEFEWDEQDAEADKQTADAAKARAEARKTRLDSGELTPQVARLIALEDGDLTQDQYDLLLKQDAEQDDPEVTLSGDTQPQDEDMMVVDQNAQPDAQTAVPGSQDVITQEQKERHDALAGPPKVEQARLDVEDDVARAINDAFQHTLDRLKKETA